MSCCADNFRLSNPGFIQTHNDGKCLEAAGLSSTSIVRMADCDGGANQQWARPDNNSMALVLTAAPNQCLHLVNGGTGRNTPVQVLNCSGINGQKWFYDNTGRLRPLSAPSMCLHIPDSNQANGVRPTLWSCNDIPAFRWYPDGKACMQLICFALWLNYTTSSPDRAKSGQPLSGISQLQVDAGSQHAAKCLL
jgi:hypothetical protein